MLTMYGPYDAEVYTYAACDMEDYRDEFFQDYVFGYGYGYGYADLQVVKQPFQCTDQSSTGSDSETFPFFQTVRCIVPPTDTSNGNNMSSSSDEDDDVDV